MSQKVETLTLANGVEMPVIGFGTFKIPDGEIVKNAVVEAIEKGYRLIDTAAVYDNEVGVGEGLRASGVAREDLFVTTKVWNTERGYDKTMAAFEASSKRLGLDVVDLYLVHWPATENQFHNWEALNRDTWQALIDLYKAGRVRSIGVSNFKPEHFEALMDMEVLPMVNQIEMNPGHQQRRTMAFCQANNIVVEAWSPLARGRILDSQDLAAIASAHGKTVAQICLKWCLQKGTVPLPKASSPERIAENIDLFDFELTAAEMAQIDTLKPFGFSGQDPNVVPF